MPRFHLTMYYPQASGEVPENIDEIMAEVEALNDDLREAGAWVAAAAFEPAPRARVVTSTDEGCDTADGPYLATEEQSGGYWIIETRGMGDAIVWASRASKALRLPVEVRALQQ